MEKSTLIELTRREVYQVMLTFEDQTDVETPSEQLEDITSEIFESLTRLKGTQMLCKPTLDLFDSMSSIEIMDPKMDIRMKRRLLHTP